MKSIIINAEDFGLNDGICRSVMELFQGEAISNSTVMICVEGAARRCKEFLDLTMSRRIGVHLQLNPENHMTASTWNRVKENDHPWRAPPPLKTSPVDIAAQKTSPGQSRGSGGSP